MQDILEQLALVSPIQVRKRLFEIGDFDFITIAKNGKKNLKQEAALQVLTNGEIREFAYGGAAGGAKSWTGATWLAFLCELYPGITCFVARKNKSDLVKSTLATFKKVFKEYGFEGIVYKAKENALFFANGSRIDFIECKHLPSDDLYERFGSLEYTVGWIEEAGEVQFKAFDVLKTRVGRNLNDRYGILPRIFITCNPKKNWLYYEFYYPWRQKKEKKHRKFIQAFLTDNESRESTYEETLKSIQDKATRARLLDGNWDYEDDPTVLCQFDAIVDSFTNDFVMPDKSNKRLSADLAMQGRDKFVVGYAEGNVIYVELVKEKATGKEIETDLKKIMIKRAVPHSRTVVDSDGLGNYLESYLTGIKEFRGGETAYDKKEFANLKAECGYKLAELINKREVLIKCTEEEKEDIIQELGVLKSDNINADDRKKRILSKKKMKEELQRSPDFLDMLIMMMIFNISRPKFQGYA